MVLALRAPALLGGVGIEQAIRTRRLALRPLPAAAAAALPDGREAAQHLLRATLSAEWPSADLLDVLPLLAAAGPAPVPFGAWVIVERESGTVVGDVGFLGGPGADRTVEIGYSVIPSRRGRGYAAEAARALVDWALEEPQVDAVVAGCEPENSASIRVLEHVGFVRAGELDGQLRWRLEA